jgi:hypothetical protein
MTEQDVRDAFARLVAAGPPPTGSDVALAAGRHARRRRTALAGSVAAVVLALAAVAALTPGWRSEAAPTAATPTPWSAAQMPQMPLTAEMTTAVVSGCADAAGLDRDRLRVHTAGDGTGGNVSGAGLVDGDSFFYCEWEWGRSGRMPTADSPFEVSPVYRFEARTTAPVVVDLRFVRRPSDGADPDDYLHAYGSVAVIGRVAPSVATVEVELGNQKTGAAIYNGVFLARFTSMIDPLPYDDGQITVRALDVDGDVVGTGS